MRCYKKMFDLCDKNDIRKMGRIYFELVTIHYEKNLECNSGNLKNIYKEIIGEIELSIKENVEKYWNEHKEEKQTAEKLKCDAEMLNNALADCLGERIELKKSMTEIKKQMDKVGFFDFKEKNRLYKIYENKMYILKNDLCINIDEYNKNISSKDLKDHIEYIIKRIDTCLIAGRNVYKSDIDYIRNAKTSLNEIGLINNIVTN